MLAVNDGALINSLIFWLLRKFFASHPSYFKMVELFHKANFTLQMGQLWDGLVVDMKRFSMDEYLSLLRYKACYYGVYLPITLAMEYCEISSDRNKSQVMDLAIDIGQYFQIQNDFLDVFGDTALTGKDGTDIQEKKFAWVICAALSRCNATQRTILETSYGKWDNNHVAHVKQVFQELDMHKVYQDFEETQSRKIQRKIEAIDESDGLRRHVISGVFSGAKKGREYRGIVRNMESSYAF
jgi:farnesyl diphosphate synthase